MKTIKEETFGKATLRLLKMADGYAGIAIVQGVQAAPLRGSDPEALWAALKNEVRKGKAEYFGFDGARVRFFSIFPHGFSDQQYRVHERNYKDEARRFLSEVLPLEAAERANSDDCQRVMQAYAKTNLLAVFEQARTREVLKSVHGPEFVRAAAAVAQGDHGAGLKAIERVFAPFGQPSWPAATYLPYFWRPNAQMFLKPQVTVDFAERVGHPFGEVYGSRLTAEVYESLLDLTARTAQEIAALSPADNIDVQSFIWVVGAYDDADAANEATVGSNG